LKKKTKKKGVKPSGRRSAAMKSLKKSYHKGAVVETSASVASVVVSSDPVVGFRVPPDMRAELDKCFKKNYPRWRVFASMLRDLCERGLRSEEAVS